MNLYQFSKNKITGLSASLLVLIALIAAFSYIFGIVPTQLRVALNVLRWVLAGTLVFVWIILNIPPPKLPSGNFIIALAQFGQEEEEDGAIRAQRRYRLRREDAEDFIDDDEVEIQESMHLKRIKQAQARKAQAALQAARQNAALPSGAGLNGSAGAANGNTALAISEHKSNVASQNMRDYTEFLPGGNGRGRAGLALPGDLDDDSTSKRNNERPILKFTPPPNQWEGVIGARSVTQYLDQGIKKELLEVGVNDVSIYLTNTFVGDGEVGVQQAETVRAHAIIWGWVPFHSRHDFVPMFELVKTV
jgi:hypothetical protein